MSNPKYEDIGSLEDKLMEECAELIQAICKGKRFGWDKFHPDRLNNNAEDALFEIEDVRKAIDRIEPLLRSQVP